jgi:hypothetical protein
MTFAILQDFMIRSLLIAFIERHGCIHASESRTERIAGCLVFRHAVTYNADQVKNMQREC